jgi:hypothetical protein
MATTRISDAIVPAIFTPYVIQRTMALSSLFRSGIITPDAQLDNLAKGAGSLYNMPYWGDLSASGRSNTGNDNPAESSVPAKIGANKDQARKHFRNKSWSSMALTSKLAGSDPMQAIADQVADYWANDMQGTLIYQLNGVIASNVANNSGDMVVNVANDAALVSGQVPAENKIGANVVLAAKQTMGDAAKALTAIVMHSALHTELQRQNLIAYIPNAAADIGFGTYLGYTVIVDDGCPVTMGSNRPTYTSYLFGRGAVGYGEGNPDVPVEVTRDAAAGNGEGMETLHNRKHFIMHPRGIKWNEVSIADVSPSDAEMQEAQQWTRVYDRKAIRFVAIKTTG